jgi:hypothetical protein
MIKKTMVLIAGIILVTGCVTTKKYEASLVVATSLQVAKENLEKKLQDTMERLKKEKADRETLERDMIKLKANRDDLVRDRESLFQTNQELIERNL